ncbi:hypothetical protein Q2454_25730, partial [Escherichia coli]|nr:hypothetical protein [Escherichia coli]
MIVIMLVMSNNLHNGFVVCRNLLIIYDACLLYIFDAADDLLYTSVAADDLVGEDLMRRRIISTYNAM